LSARIAVLAALALAGCGNKSQPTPGDAAPPAGVAPPPEPSASASAEPPKPPPPACPEGMLLVAGTYCVDKWEASLVDKETKTPLSPYYPPDRRLAARLHDTWEEDRATMGDEKARAMPLPPLPIWQRVHDPDPMAVSRPGVVPNGYLSGTVAEKACLNAGKRLCTSDEWVTACEGEAKQPFPYGDHYQQGACNIFRAAHPALVLHDDASTGHLDPRLNLVREPNGDPLLRKTGQTPACKSVWGADAAWDMNGNLDEWVDDDKGRFAGGFYSRSKRDGCKSAVTAHGKSYQDYSTGARCCWSP
jgi:formylglycine-generating enzyme